MNKFSKKEIIKEFCFAFFASGIPIIITMLYFALNAPTDFRLLKGVAVFLASFVICLVGILLSFADVFFIPYGIILIVIFPVSIYYLYKKLPVSKIKYRKYLLTVIVTIWGLYGLFAAIIWGDFPFWL